MYTSVQNNQTLRFITFFCVPLDTFRLSSLPVYYIPKDGSLQSYKVCGEVSFLFASVGLHVWVCVLFTQDHVVQLPAVDHPEAFGQHPNADIASQIKETRCVCVWCVCVCGVCVCVWYAVCGMCVCMCVVCVHVHVCLHVCGVCACVYMCGICAVCVHMIHVC